MQCIRALIFANMLKNGQIKALDLFICLFMKKSRKLAFVRGTSPLTRVAILAELSVAPVSDRLVSDAVVAVWMPSVSAVIPATFLSSVSDTRGLVAAAVALLGAQPIALSDERRHSVLVRVLVVVVPLASTH